MPKKFIFVLIVLSTTCSYAQQTPFYNQYYVNPFLYNPSTAGQDGTTKAFLLYRKQWVGINGAPETFSFTMDGKLKKQPVGLGINVSNDVNNVVGRTNFGLSGSYTAALTNDQSIAFGLSTQIIQTRVFFDKIQVEDINDPNLLRSIDQKTAFEMSAGLSYQWKSLNVGFAADQLLQNGVTFESTSQFESVDFNFVRHYIGSIQYTFELNRDFDLEPLLLTRIVQGLPTQFDASLIGTYQDKLWASTTYRHDIGVAFALGFEIQKQITIGYSYEIPTTNLSELGGSSHEFLIGWRFNPGQRQTAVSTVVPIGRKSQKLSDLEKESAAQYQEIDELRQRNEKMSKELDDSNTRFNQQQEEIDLLKDQLDGYQQEIRSIKKQSSQVIERMDDDTKGSFFVVIGAFKTLKASKSFQQIIKRKNGPNTRIIQNESGTFYFIYTKKFERLSDALSELETAVGSHIADEITGNPWIYFDER